MLHYINVDLYNQLVRQRAFVYKLLVKENGMATSWSSPFFSFFNFLVGLHLIRPRAIWLAYVSIIDNVFAMFELGEEEVRTWEYTKLGGRISPRLIRCVCVRGRERFTAIHNKKILKIVSITHLMHLMRAALPGNAKD